MSSVKPADEQITITERLWQDAYGSLDRAVRADGRKVLVKSWKPQRVDPFSFREQRLLEHLEAAGLLRVLGMERPDGVGGCRFVLEDPGGVPLRTFWNTRPLRLDDALALAQRLTELLERLHGLGVVHLDFRPDHLLVEPRTLAVHLIDFRHAVLLDDPAPPVSETPRGVDATKALGAADLPVVGEDGGGQRGDAGGLPYRAPELFLGRPADRRADLCALGVVLYEALTGRPPFAAESPSGWRHAHLARRPIEPRCWGGDIPAHVWSVLDRLLAKEPGERYPSATASSSMVAAGPIANEAGVPILSTSTTAEGITAIGDYVFRNALPETKAIPFEVQRVVAVYHPRSAAILYARDDDYTGTFSFDEERNPVMEPYVIRVEDGSFVELQP